MSKKRTRFAVLGSILVVILVLNSVIGLAAAPKYNWKLASVLPESHPIHKTLVFFADKVAEKTKGEVKITVYPAGQLGQEKDYMEGAKIGTIEITKVSTGPLGQYSPGLQALSLPFIWRNIEHQHQVLDGKVGKKLMADLEKSGFKGLAFFDAGFRSVTAQKPIKTPADLKGLKIRVMQSKPLVDSINGLGATAVPMGQSEVYVALQQKVIDGWENNEPTVLAFNMQEVCKYFSYTLHSSIPDIMVMNKRVFDSVPSKIQKAIMSAAAEMVPVQRKAWADMIEDTVKQLKAKGMEFNEVNDIREFQALVKPLYKEYEPIVGKDLINDIQK